MIGYFKKSEKGNAVLAAVVILALVGIGGGAYYTTTSKAEAQNGQSASAQEPEAGETASVPAVVEEAAQVQDPESQEPPFELKPGNPVVLKLNDEEVTRVDLLRFMQTFPPQVRQQPLDAIYPLAQEQLINNQLITQKLKDVDLSGDEDVQRQLDEAREAIERTIFMQKEVQKRLTEERLKSAYDIYAENFPKDLVERRARHILVDDEAVAKDLIKQLNDGGDFAELAKANSKDSTAENGGLLNYFSKTEVVPEFANAAFELELGSYTKDPVKSQFGYHVILSEEERTRPPVPFEEAKQPLETELRNVILDEILSEWRGDAKIERFDINGETIEPAAGE